MKKQYFISALFLLAIVSLGKYATSNSNQPPTGYASAPTNFANCTSCHGGTALNGGGGNVNITFSGANNQYAVSTAYTVTVTVTDAARNYGGFECVAYNMARAQAGSFTVTNSTNTSLQTTGGKQYIGHKNSSTTKSWSFTWTAPATIPAGNRIIFYCSGNAANGTGSENGDHIYSDSLVITPLCTAPTTPSISGTTTFCQGQSTTLSVSNTCGGCTYNWSNGGSGASVSVSTAGTYNVVASNTCGSATSTSVSVTQNPLPTTPTVTGNTTICSGQSTTLSVSNTCGGCTYNWSNGTSGTSASINTGGTYTVVASNSCGSATSSSVTVTQNTLPTTPTVTGNTAICSGQSTTLSVSNTCGGCTYNWSNGGSGTSINVNTAGNYHVVVSNSCGSATSSDAVVTVSSSAVTPVIAGNTAICSGQPTTLSVSNTCGGCTYNWSNGGSGTSISVSTAGTYHVVVSSTCGSATSSDVVVTVGQAPVTPSISGANTVCQGQSTTLSVSNTCGGCTYNWSNGASGTSASITTGGNYHVVASNGCGSVTSSDFTVTQNPLPNTPVITGSTFLCSGQPTTLQVSNTCGGCTYNWSNGASGSSATINTAGTYHVVASNSCGSVTSADVVVSNGSTPPSPSISGNTTICEGQPNVIYVSNPCGGCTYSWSNGASGDSSTISAQGTYSVSVTNSCGGQASSSVNINSNPSPTVNVSAAGGVLTANATNAVSYQWFFNGNIIITGATQATYTPLTSGDYTVVVTGANGCTTTSTTFHYDATGIETIPMSRGISVYPTVATDEITVEVKGTYAGLLVAVYDVDGKLWTKQAEIASNNLYKINVSYIPKGVYIVRVFNAFESATYKVIKE